MTSASRNQYVPDVVSPPGGTLEDLLEERGMSQAQLAERTGRPKKTINEIIKGKAAITPETALQLELVLGTPADFWNQREKRYRAYMARREEDQQLATWHEWQKRFPVRDMIRRGWIPEVSRRADKVRELLRFFGVVSPQQWEEVHAEPQAQFRKSTAFETDSAALSVWLARGEHLASEVACQPFDKTRFKDSLGFARGLSRLPIDEAIGALEEQCAASGVAVVLVPQVSKCRASGATRWISSEKAIIQLSLRYKTDDHFWYTFFHEAGHILLHGKRAIFVETNGAKDDAQEQAADKFANQHLIRPKDFAQWRSRGRFSKREISSFAEAIGIAPGIVVGRLQHEGLLPRNHCNDLKRRLKWVSGT